MKIAWQAAWPACGLMVQLRHLDIHLASFQSPAHTATLVSFYFSLPFQGGLPASPQFLTFGHLGMHLESPSSLKVEQV